MDNTSKKHKLLTICILPVFWLLYFLFEIITGRVNDLYTLILNLSLTIIFAFVGWVIYKFSELNPLGFKTKTLFIIFTILMLIDQGIKFIIGKFFFNNYFEIIPDFLSFHPIINTHGSWLNARFNAGVNFTFLIVINLISLLLILEVYRYYSSKGNKSFWSDMCLLFIFAGALCSLIDKVFYGGSLDFIGISDLFIADIKDIYINIGLLFFLMTTYISGYLSDDTSTTLKEDFQGIKKFLVFVKKDFLSIVKREKA